MTSEATECPRATDAAPVHCEPAAGSSGTAAHMLMRAPQLPSGMERGQATSMTSLPADTRRAAQDQACHAEQRRSEEGHEGTDDCGDVLCEERACRTSPGQSQLHGCSIQSPHKDHHSAGVHSSLLPLQGDSFDCFDECFFRRYLRS